ncbi:hypothetical protein A0H81_01725 [Grifola frondosa]|uniref:Uncharacterized protein n=1 Tax=Grifola frondosa TaxID=5627 RepID=A0A1C7MLA8_GRIFR|nr:hypothetical protein A0H81_01725 [Grifola frondosa]
MVDSGSLLPGTCQWRCPVQGSRGAYIDLLLTSHLSNRDIRMAADHQTAIRITRIALSRADGDRIANNIYVRILDDQAELYKTSLAVGATKLNQWQISFDVPGPCFTVHVMQQRRFRRSDYDVGSATVVPADFSTREAGCICKKTFGLTSQGNPTGIEVFLTFVGIRATSPVQTRLASTLPEPAMQHSSVRRSVE